MVNRRAPDLTTHASLLGASFASKVDILGSIVQDAHYPSVGRYKERLLADAIRHHVPEGFAVGSGFVLFPREVREDEIPPAGFDPLNMSGYDLSRECDVIVYDATLAPPVFKDEDFVVVRPEAVRSIIEVKGALRPDGVDKTLAAFLDFGRKWRATQQFYAKHHKVHEGRPGLHLLAWSIGEDAGRRVLNGTKLRDHICQFHKEHVDPGELSGLPLLDSALVYDDCMVNRIYHVGDTDSVGWMTFSGKFVGFDDAKNPVRTSDRTIASLLGSIHCELGTRFNRFFSYVDQTNLEPDYEHDGYSPWLTDEVELRAVNKSVPDAQLHNAPDEAPPRS